ncbi:hypothetical protein PtA15_16A306 [Puccinia triticina]|uniref:Uncharacterized protein n=1 Tax=Puccinia triticina TaxID=208348 RepID=A0ABY7D714_9BASI|nr:uncharacterized protein PtA15_16A306 [Puccinia triticina]WAQ92398.1 hypothetical protein PtA15_16A306 [Puccinia triticina]
MPTLGALRLMGILNNPQMPASSEPGMSPMRVYLRRAGLRPTPKPICYANGRRSQNPPTYMENHELHNPPPVSLPPAPSPTLFNQAQPAINFTQLQPED